MKFTSNPAWMRSSRHLGCAPAAAQWIGLMPLRLMAAKSVTGTKIFRALSSLWDSWDFLYKPAYNKERRERLAKVQGVGKKIKANWIMKPMLSRRDTVCVCLPLCLVPLFTNSVCDAQWAQNSRGTTMLWSSVRFSEYKASIFHLWLGKQYSDSPKKPHFLLEPKLAWKTEVAF